MLVLCAELGVLVTLYIALKVSKMMSFFFRSNNNITLFRFKISYITYCNFLYNSPFTNSNFNDIPV